MTEWLRVFLLTNSNFAWSFMELFKELIDKPVDNTISWIPLLRRWKLAKSLAKLERQGLIESKVIDGRKYYIAKRKDA